jgi:hypothetical protein
MAEIMELKNIHFSEIKIETSAYERNSEGILIITSKLTEYNSTKKMETNILRNWNEIIIS